MFQANACWIFLGYLTDRRTNGCPKCHVGQLGLEDGRSEDGTGLAYVCGQKKCRHRESVTLHEHGLFLPRVSLSKQMLVIYRMIYHNMPGVSSLASDADMDEGYVSVIVSNVRAIATWEMKRACALLQIGGEDEDCEIDEVSFRSKRVWVEGVLLRPAATQANHIQTQMGSLCPIDTSKGFRGHPSPMGPNPTPPHPTR